MSNARGHCFLCAMTHVIFVSCIFNNIDPCIVFQLTMASKSRKLGKFKRKILNFCFFKVKKPNFPKCLSFIELLNYYNNTILMCHLQINMQKLHVGKYSYISTAPA